MPLRRTLRSGETVEVSHPIERSEAFWGHGRDPNDQAWSNSIQRRDAVIARAPAAAEAWSLVDTVNLRSSIVPVDLATAPYVPADHYAEHPEHGAGIVTGPQGAGWGLLAICDDSGAGWASWVNANAFDTKRVDGKYDKPKGLRNYDVNHDRIQRPLGTKVEVMWELIPDDQTDQYHLPRVRTFRGNVDHLGLAALASMTVAMPMGRHLLSPYLGAWTFRRRALADGLTVWPSGAVVPVAGGRQGQRLRLHGGGALQVNPNDASWYGWCPAWLLANLGGRR